MCVGITHKKGNSKIGWLLSGFHFFVGCDWVYVCTRRGTKRVRDLVSGFQSLVGCVCVQILWMCVQKDEQREWVICFRGFILTRFLNIMRAYGEDWSAWTQASRHTKSEALIFTCVYVHFLSLDISFKNVDIHTCIIAQTSLVSTDSCADYGLVNCAHVAMLVEL